jgi:hypothetical protein
MIGKPSCKSFFTSILLSSIPLFAFNVHIKKTTITSKKGRAWTRGVIGVRVTAEIIFS